MNSNAVQPEDFRGFTPAHRRYGNSRDATPHLQQALVTANRERVALDLGSGYFNISEPLGMIDKPIAVLGPGIGVCQIRTQEPFEGPVIEVRSTVDFANPGIGLETADQSLNNKGALLQGFSLIGHRSKQQTGIRTSGTNGSLTMRDVHLSYFNGPGLQLAFGREGDNRFGAIRESHFDNVQVYHSGNEEFAAVDLDEAYKGDGSNQTTFNNLRIVYPYGKGLRIKNDYRQPVRRLVFNSLMLHGLPHDAKPPVHTLLHLEGYVMASWFNNVRLNHWRKGFSAIHLKRSPVSGLAPKEITVQGAHLVQGEGDMIRVDAGTDINLNDVRRVADEEILLGPDAEVYRDGQLLSAPNKSTEGGDG